MDRRGVLGWFFGVPAAAATTEALFGERQPVIIKGPFVPVAGDIVVALESVDRQTRTYHTREPLRFNYQTDPRGHAIRGFEARLQELAGVTSVRNYNQYEVLVSKSACYSWDEIEPVVLKAILVAQGV